MQNSTVDTRTVWIDSIKSILAVVNRGYNLTGNARFDVDPLLMTVPAGFL